MQPSGSLPLYRVACLKWCLLSSLLASTTAAHASSTASTQKTLAQLNANLQQTGQGLQDVKRLEQEAEQLKSERKFDQAISVLTRALELREKTPGVNPLDIAVALSDLGELAFLAGKYDHAITFMDRALTIREKALPPDDSLIAESLSDVAALYIRQGDLVTPEPLLQRALSIKETRLGPNSLEVASTLNTLATLYEERGDRKTAEPLYKRALAIREKELPEQHRQVAISLNNLGRLYMANRDFARAEPLYERSLKIREGVLGAENPDLATPLINLATLYYETGQFSEAEPLFQRALRLQQKGLNADHPALITTIHNLAEVYRHQRRFDEAESLYKQSLAVATKSLSNDHSLVATVLRGYALLQEARGDFNAAASFLRRTIDIQERNLSLILTAGSQSQKLLYLRTVSDETDLVLSLHLQNSPADVNIGRLALSTLLQRKGRVLDVMSASIEALRRRASPEDVVLINQLTEARNELAKLNFTTTSQADKITKIKDLETEIGRLEAAISTRSSRFRAQSQPITLDRVQRAIPDKSCLIEFVTYRTFNVHGKTREESFGPTHYAAYILTNTGAPGWVRLGEAKSIDRAVERFRRSLRSSANTDYRRTGRALDQLLMTPLRRFIGANQHLFISPDGILNLIPFAALVDERNRYLAQRYTITYLSSGRDLLRLQVKAGTKEVPVVVANPAFHDAPANADTQGAADTRSAIDFRRIVVEPLPETAREAEEFKTLFPDAKMFTGRSATEAVIKEVSGPNVLHIATHGFFFSDETAAPGSRNLVISKSQASATSMDPLLRSGLLLAGVSIGQSGKGEDGVLTALEVANLNLWGTKLVVLSACETGLGDVYVGEGVFGLRRALVLAGAESQVISLWRVSDLATRELMSDYYSSIKQSGLRADALRRVQLKMIDRGNAKGRVKRRFSHPFYWASFIQSGDWRSITSAK